jgi:predicted outer membrane repeat protein
MFEIEETRFENNQALKQGGALSYSKVKPTIGENVEF